MKLLEQIRQARVKALVSFEGPIEPIPEKHLNLITALEKAMYNVIYNYKEKR